MKMKLVHDDGMDAAEVKPDVGLFAEIEGLFEHLSLLDEDLCSHSITLSKSLINPGTNHATSVVVF